MTLLSRPCAPSSLVVRGIYNDRCQQSDNGSLGRYARGSGPRGPRGNPTHTGRMKHAQFRSTCWRLGRLFQYRGRIPTLVLLLYTHPNQRSVEEKKDETC